MKLIRIKIAAVIMTMASMLASCTKETPQGMVIFTLSEDDSVVELTKGSVSSYTSLPKADDFTITIKDDFSTFWTGKISEWDPETKLSSGDYVVEASYGKEGEEGYDKPYFFGSQKFTVNGNETNKVSIPVSLANCIVRAVFGSGFQNYFPQAYVYVTTSAGADFPYNYKTAKAAFIEPSKITVSVSLTSQNGEERSVVKEYAGLQPATCYTMYFTTSEIGGSSFTISFNDTVETVDLGIIKITK